VVSAAGPNLHRGVIQNQQQWSKAAASAKHCCSEAAKHYYRMPFYGRHMQQAMIF